MADKAGVLALVIILFVFVVAICVIVQNNRSPSP